MKRSALLLLTFLFPFFSVYSQFSVWAPEEGVRVSHQLQLEWEENGTAMNTSGFTLITWSDARNGDQDIFAQLLDPGGSPQWQPGGVCIASSDGPQQDPYVIDDLKGAWIIAWKDYRSDYDPTQRNAGELCVQKIDAQGNPMWNVNGVRVCPGYTSTEYPVYELLPDGDGGCTISFTNEYDEIIVQRIDMDGELLWDESGIVVAENVLVWRMDVASDQEGGLFLCWIYGSGNSEVYAQHISFEGEGLWCEAGEGIPVSDIVLNPPIMAICRDGAGGAFIAWENQLEGWIICGQHVDQDGELVWDESGVQLMEDQGSQQRPKLIEGNPGEAILVWDRCSNSFEVFITLQKFTSDSLGPVFLWGDASNRFAGLPVSLPGEISLNHHIASDHSGGAVVSWQKYDLISDYDNRVRFQHVNASGQLLVEETEVVQYSDYIINWSDVCASNFRIAVPWSQKKHDLFGVNLNLFNHMGSPVVEDSIVVIEGLRGQVESSQIINSDNIPYSCWLERRVHIEDGRILLQAHDFDTGALLFDSTGFLVIDSTINGEPFPDDYTMESFAITPDNHNGAVVAFFSEGYPTASPNLGIQRISQDGTRQWNQMGRFIQPGPYSYDGINNLDLARFADSTFLLITSVGTTGSDHALWCYGFDINGNPSWVSHPEGVLLDDDDAETANAKLLGLQENGVAVVYYNYESQLHLYAQIIQSDGDVLWEEPVFAIVPTIFLYEHDVDHFGDMLLISSRQSYPNHSKVACQLIDMEGNTSFDAQGFPLVEINSRINSYSLATDSTDCFWMAWQEGESIFANRWNGDMESVLPDSNPVLVAYSTCNDASVELVPDDAGGVYLFWNMFANDHRQVDLRYTHLTDEGEIAHPGYGEDGSLLCGAWNDQVDLSVARDGFGGTIAGWHDFRPSVQNVREELMFNDFYCMRVNDGTVDEVRTNSSPIPDACQLLPAYPNPFNPSVTIPFTLHAADQVTITMYNVLGQKVATLLDTRMNAGFHELAWNSISSDGSELAAGIYFVRLSVSNGTAQVQKIVLLK